MVNRLLGGSPRNNKYVASKEHSNTSVILLLFLYYYSVCFEFAFMSILLFQYLFFISVLIFWQIFIFYFIA